MTKIEIDLDLNLSSYDNSVRGYIAEYLQNMDIFLGMRGINMDVEYFNCEVM